MKKLLFVIPTLGGGGAERSLVNLLNELPKEKYEIDLLLFKKEGIFLPQVPQYVNILKQPYALKKLYSPVFKSGKYLPVKVIGNIVSRIFEKGMSAQKAFLWKYFYTSFIEKMDKEYDVAIGYLGGESTDFILDKVKAQKYIHWVHNDYKKLGMSPKYDIDVFKKVDDIVTISDECLNILKDEFPQFVYKMHSIANITSSKVIKDRAKEFIPKEYEDEENNIFLSIGRLSEQKGFDMAISAASKLKEQGLKFKWYIIGEGGLKSSLLNQIQSEKVEDCVELLGLISNPYPYIKNCKLFIQPSRFEGKSVVLEEAKILAKPIVVTAYPTVLDQIENNKEGLIAEISADSIAKQIMELVKNNVLYEQIQNYLFNNEYGNQEELEKYIDLFG